MRVCLWTWVCIHGRVHTLKHTVCVRAHMCGHVHSSPPPWAWGPAVHLLKLSGEVWEPVDPSTLSG